jgi:hypothetical protein
MDSALSRLESAMTASPGWIAEKSIAALCRSVCACMEPSLLPDREEPNRFGDIELPSRDSEISSRL